MARTEALQRPTHLKYKQRAAIFHHTFQKVVKNYFDPNYNGTDWPRHAKESRDQILAIQDPEPFELAMHELVRRLRTSHTGFFHESVRRVPGRLAIGATFRNIETPDGNRWIVQEVHEGGPASRAGVRPLDVLIDLRGTAITPPEQPMFPMGTQINLSVQRGSQKFGLTVDIPVPRSRKQPYSEPTPVSFSKLKDRVGYLKHNQRRRDGLRFCPGKSSGHYRGQRNRRPPDTRFGFQGWIRISSDSSKCRVHHVAGTNVRRSGASA